MKYAVRVFNFNEAKLLSTEQFNDGHAADEYYYDTIRLVRKFVESGECYLVARYNSGELMVFEVIKG